MPRLSKSKTDQTEVVTPVVEQVVTPVVEQVPTSEKNKIKKEPKQRSLNM